MVFKKIDRVSMSEEIIDHLKTQIISRSLKPGEKLPSEENLAEKMGVGRGTIREALRVLIHMGLVERKGNGTYVTEGKISNNYKFKLDEYRDLVEIMEVRKVVEPALAKYAAERRNTEVVKEIGKELQKMKEGIQDVNEFILHDNKFHDLIFDASGNSILEGFIKGLKVLMKKNQAVVLRERYSYIMPKSLDFHEKIYQAILNNNGEEAYKLMLNHIEDVEDEFEKITEGD